MSKKRYKRASEFYENAELDKALMECEKGISENLKEASLLNLKGIILYQRGNLDEAIITWNINRDFNDDDLAKVYINDSKKDLDNKINYEKGERALKELKIDNAIAYFDKCKKSSFNGIRLNTALAFCYMKKGMVDESKYYALKALNIDKNYSSAKNIIKEIEGIQKNTNKISLKSTLIVIALMVFVGGIILISNKSGKFNPEIEAVDKSNGVNNGNEFNENAQNIEEKTLDISLIKHTISEEDVDKLYELLKDVDKFNVKNDDLFIIENGVEILKTKGVEKFYDNGRKALKNKELEKAGSQLEKAYSYGKEHYLYPHIVYLRGSTLDELMNKEQAIVYYEEYINTFKEGDYREEALYKLSLIYRVLDKEKCKQYAKELKNKYPKSIYNNNIIKEILEN